MPAETEPHRRTLIAWPPDVPQCIFTPDQLEPARARVRARSCGRSRRTSRSRSSCDPDDVDERAPSTSATAAEILAAADRRRLDPRRRPDRRARARRRAARRALPLQRVGRQAAVARRRRGRSAPTVARAPRPAGARGADGARRRVDRGRRPGHARHDRALPAEPESQSRAASRADIEARAARRSSAPTASCGSPTRSPRTTAPTVTSTTSSRSRPTARCSCRAATTPRTRTPRSRPTTCSACARRGLRRRRGAGAPLRRVRRATTRRCRT